MRFSFASASGFWTRSAATSKPFGGASRREGCRALRAWVLGFPGLVGPVDPGEWDRAGAWGAAFAMAPEA